MRGVLLVRLRVRTYTQRRTVFHVRWPVVNTAAKNITSHNKPIARDDYVLTDRVCDALWNFFFYGLRLRLCKRRVKFASSSSPCPPVFFLTSDRDTYLFLFPWRIEIIIHVGSIGIQSTLCCRHGASVSFEYYRKLLTTVTRIIVLCFNRIFDVLAYSAVVYFQKILMGAQLGRIETFCGFRRWYILYP